MSATPWIVIHYRKGFVCERCGGEETVAFPIPMDLWLRWARMFLRQHKGCK